MKAVATEWWFRVFMALAILAVLAMILAPLSAALPHGSAALTHADGVTAEQAPCGPLGIAGCDRREAAVDLSCCASCGCNLPVPTLARAALVPAPSWRVARFAPAGVAWRDGIAAHPAVPPPRPVA